MPHAQNSGKFVLSRDTASALVTFFTTFQLLLGFRFLVHKRGHLEEHKTNQIFYFSVKLAVFQPASPLKKLMGERRWLTKWACYIRGPYNLIHVYVTNGLVRH